MIYEKMMSAWNEDDLEGWKSVYHAEYEFLSHANGKTMTLEKQRCIYEDDNVLVEQSLATFGSGAKEAVMTDHNDRKWHHSSIKLYTLNAVL